MLRPVAPLITVMTVLSCSAVASADSALRGPVSGYVFDSRFQSIRPIEGLPGSSHLGSPLELPFTLRRASLCPSTDIALAVRSEDGGVFVIRGFKAGRPEVVPVAGAIADPDLVVCNQTGSVGLIYSKAARSMQFLCALANDAVSTPAFDVSSLGDIRAMAIHPGATQALVGTSDRTEGALYLITASPDPAFRPLGRFATPSAITYLNAGKDASVADSSTNEISFIADVSGAAGVNVIARGADGIQTPVALQPAAGNKLLITNAALNTISVLDLASLSVAQTIPLTDNATRCEVLTDHPVFALNDPRDGHLFVLDFGPAPKVFFVLLD